MTIEHSEPQNQPPVRIENQGNNTIFFRGEEPVGYAFQNPISPEVLDPGLWRASINTPDDAMWSFGPFKTRRQAIEAGLNGLKLNLTYQQWEQTQEKK